MSSGDQRFITFFFSLYLAGSLHVRRPLFSVQRVFEFKLNTDLQCDFRKIRSTEHYLRRTNAL